MPEGTGDVIVEEEDVLEGVEDMEVINLDEVASECGTVMKFNLVSDQDKVVHADSEGIRKKETVSN